MSHDEHVDCDKQIAELTAQLEAKTMLSDGYRESGYILVKEIKRLKEALGAAENKVIPQKLCIGYLSQSVAHLWDAVAEGKYDARSTVGDTVLDMITALEDIGINASGKQALEQEVK